MTDTTNTLPGVVVDASGQSQQKAGRIDISQQQRRMSAVVALSAVAGSLFTVFGFSGLLAVAAVHAAEPPQDPSIFIQAAVMCFAATVLLLLYVGGISGRLLKYVYNSELIIRSQDLGLKELNADNTWLSACLRQKHAGAGEADGVAMNSPSATIHQFNGKRT